MKLLNVVFKVIFLKDVDSVPPIEEIEQSSLRFFTNKFSCLKDFESLLNN